MITNNTAAQRFGYIGGGLEEKESYFYHSDHLGSTSYLTDIQGNVRQYTAYMPYGEGFVSEHTTSSELPYLFNGKPLDEETNLYYYGARYYDPRDIVWRGVDPLAEKYPNIGGYVYCADNPITLVDPDGRQPQDYKGGFSPREEKLRRAAAAARRTNEAGSRVFNGSVSVSGNVWGAGVKAEVFGVGAEVKAEAVSVSGKVSTEPDKLISAKATGVEVKGKMSARGASAQAKVSLLNGSVNVGRDGDVSVDGNWGEASAKAEVGNGTIYAGASNFKSISLGAKVSVIKAEATIDFGAIGDWFRGVGETIIELLTPEEVHEFNYYLRNGGEDY